MGQIKNWINHHLYVCKKDCVSLLNHLGLRDYLRENPIAKIEYAKLKKDLARKYPYDMDSYIEGKTEFITNILEKLDFDKVELEKVKEQNKAK